MHQLTVILVFATVLALPAENGGWRHEVRVNYQDIYVSFWASTKHRPCNLEIYVACKTYCSFVIQYLRKQRLACAPMVQRLGKIFLVHDIKSMVYSYAPAVWRFMNECQIPGHGKIHLVAYVGTLVKRDYKIFKI
jgi:hypothetical protein